MRSFSLLCLTLLTLTGQAHALNWSYLSNGTVKIGVIADWGAGIGYFSRVSPERNLLNYADKGREVQQSYYGSANGTTWNGTAWKWNPVQAGDAFNNPSTVLTLTNDGTTIYAKIVPKDWASNNVDDQGYMEEWITLSGDVAKIHFKFTYTGSTTQASTDQELPAMFVDYALPNLVTYRGSSPWTNGATTSIVPADLVGTSNATNFNVTEQWSAYVDGSNWGIGMFTPGNVNRRTSYRYSSGGSGPTGTACSYVAPVGTWSFSPTTGTNKGPVYEYDAYLTIGSLTDIRSRFYALQNGSATTDTTAPAVSITAPANNSTATGTVSVTANATDDVGVSKVEFYLNGSLVATDTATPYLYSWNTSSLAAGTYTWMAKAYDAAGNVKQSSSVSVAVAKDTTAPTVSLTAPASGATVSGTTTVSASASDNLGVSKVEFYEDGALLSATNVAPYSYNWNTATATNGSHVLSAKAYDAAGNVGQSSSLSVTVNNAVADTTKPTVSLSAPAAGATVSGTAAVSVSASDNVGVTKVEFYVNGALQATDTATPYTFTWNTASVANGSYTLSAKAYDAAGNIGQSANVSVNVANSTGGTTTTAVFGNASGSTYTGTVEDTFLNIDASVNATATSLNTYTWPANTPANAILMKWALSSLPANAQILSATLSLYQTAGGGDAQYQIPVSQVINKNPVVSKCNGTTYDGTSAWTASSIPYGGVPLAQSDIAAAVDAPVIDQTVGYKSWNVTTIVQDWVANPANNRGLLLDSSSKATADSYRSFASSEATDATQRPKLTITYTLAQAADTAAPTVSLTAPAGGTAVSGTATVTASASDNVGVAKVEFYVNGALQGTDTASPYSFSWNTAGLANGSYTLSAKAYDAAGNVGQSSSVSVTVNNVVADTTKPTVSLSSPAAGATVSGTAAVSVSASDNVGVTKVEFYLNGALQATDTASPYSFSWNTASVANGSYTLSAKAYDAAGNVGLSAGVTVNVANSATTYTAVFGNASGSTYTGTVEDTFLNIDASVNATATSLTTYTWPANTPANAILMKWTLSSLPANAKIVSATLSLYQTAGGGDAQYQIPVSKVINKSPVVSKCNGKTYDGANAWTASSIPYGGIPLAQSDIAPAVDTPAVDKTVGYKNWNVTSIVQDWVANPANNRGLLLDSSSKATADSYRSFASSEATNSAQRPKLTVTYTLQ